MFSAGSSRYLHFVALLVVVAIPPTPLYAQTGAPQGTVRQVTTREIGGVIEIEIVTSGPPVFPNTQAITGPDRIVVDFPGATPSAALRALKVNRGVLKGVRSGLFFRDPPITRIVLDLTGPQSYNISTTDHTTVVKLTGAAVGEQNSSARAADAIPAAQTAQSARLREATLATRPGIAAAHLAPASAVGETSPMMAPQPSIEPPQPAAVPDAAPPPPVVSVTYENGMLRILADKATLSQVLYEVHVRTQAEIAIPAGAEQERVVADLGPAPARDVLAELLNGSPYNFIFVGEELSLERVILTRRAGSF